MVNFDVLKALKFKERVAKFRGDIIEEGNAILYELEFFLRILEIEKPSKEDGKYFKACFDLWREILHKDPKLKKSTKQLRRDVHHSIETRNIYAHGELGFINDEPSIEYEKGKEIVKESINEEIMLEKFDLMRRAKKGLRELNLKLKKHRDE
jgi:hypothetical protein